MNYDYRTTVQTSPRRLRAYSLMELLMVVAVIAVISIAGVSFLGAKADQTKIETAAKQMKNYLQAGLTYYGVHESWPTSSQLRYTYLNGVYGVKNPWGKSLTVGRGGAKSGQFYVQTAVPDRAIGERLAGELGSAEYTTSGGVHYVTAYAGTAVQEQEKNILVAEVGNQAQPSLGSKLGGWSAEGSGLELDDDGDWEDANAVKSILTNGGPIKIPKPKCPSGYTQHFAVYMAGIQKGCFLEQEVEALKQCDERCSTWNREWGGDYGFYEAFGSTFHTKTYCNYHYEDFADHYRRTGSDRCCPGGMSLFGDCLNPNTEYISRMNCGNYGSMDDLAYLVGAALVAMGGFVGIVGGGSVIGLAADLDNKMQSQVGMLEDVEIVVENDNASCTNSPMGKCWEIYVKTINKRPHEQVIGMDYFTDFVSNVGDQLESFFTGGGWTSAAVSFDAHENYRGSVSYMSYCKPQ